MARHWEHTNYRPSTVPRGYQMGLPAAVEILRAELRDTGYEKDALGNTWPAPLSNKLPQALAKVESAGLMPALKDYLADFPGIDEEEALLALVGDPTQSDEDSGLSIPFTK